MVGRWGARGGQVVDTSYGYTSDYQQPSGTSRIEHLSYLWRQLADLCGDASHGFRRWRAQRGLRRLDCQLD